MRRPDLMLLAALLLRWSALPGPALAQDAQPAAPVPLDTRAAQHDGFGRLVFAGTNGHSVPLSADVDGSTLTIHFQSPVAPSLDPVRRGLAGYLDGLSLSADGKTLTAHLKKPVTLHPTRLGGDTQVIDLMDQPKPQAADAKPADTKPAEAKPQTAEAKPQTPEAKPQTPEAKPQTPEAKPQTKAAAGKTPPTQPPATQAQPAQNQPAVTAPTPLAPEAPPKETAQAAPAPAAPAPQAVAKPPASALEPVIGAALGKSTDNGLQIHYTTTDVGASIRFQWTVPAAAAVFQRSGAVWIVFDRPQKLDFASFKPATANIGGASPIVGVSQVPTRSGTALRLKTQGDLFPAVRRAGNDWIVELSPRIVPPAAPLASSVQDDGENAALVFAALDPGSPISMVDPEVGDTLVVVPLPGLGQGVDTPADYPNLTVLPSAQGLVFRPKSDQLAVRQLTGAIEVSAPGGLTLSGDTDRTMAPRPPRLSGSLMNPGDWAGPSNSSVLVRETAMLAATARATPEARTGQRLDLAKYYFANGFDSEALGVLQVAEGDVPNLTDDPAIKLMQGACELLLGQIDLAAADLSDHALDGRADTALWRGVLAEQKGDWTEAGSLAQQGLPALKSYPPVLRRQLDASLAEALMRQGDKKNAEALANDILKSDPARGQRDYATVLLGRLALEKGGDNVAVGEALFKKVAASPEIDLGRAQAGYALAMTQLQNHEISLPEAIAAIDRLRYAWRGDDFEILVLRKLADLYAQDNDYRMAFETLQRIPAGFPGTPAARDATAQMQKTFGSIFLGPTADALPPLTALALYDEFKELTPPGTDGDAIVRKLADRLVSVDLLGRAGDLLDNQVKTRLSGVDQARVAAQLALVRLMDNRPADAMTALDVPVTGDMPPDLQRQRAELRARALTELGKPDDAVKLLADDDSADADRLRGDVAVKTQNWPMLATLLQKGLKDPGADGKIDAETSARVVRVATAMALGHDKAGLDALTKKYGGAMESGPDRDAFRVVSGSGAGADAATGSLADRIAQVGELQSFMSSYRQRVQQDKLSAIN